MITPEEYGEVKSERPLRIPDSFVINEHGPWDTLWAYIFVIEFVLGLFAAGYVIYTLASKGC